MSIAHRKGLRIGVIDRRALSPPESKKQPDLTDQEKRRNTIYAALVDLEWDEATEGWATGDMLRIALQLGS